jgi:transposase-like protein
MDIEDFAADYLVDKNETMRKVTESILNEVMQIEASRQIQAQPYEILSAALADSEDESCWEDLFEDLKTRGLNGVELVISDWA